MERRQQGARSQPPVPREAPFRAGGLSPGAPTSPRPAAPGTLQPRPHPRWLPSAPSGFLLCTTLPRFYRLLLTQHSSHLSLSYSCFHCDPHACASLEGGCPDTCFCGGQARPGVTGGHFLQAPAQPRRQPSAVSCRAGEPSCAHCRLPGEVVCLPLILSLVSPLCQGFPPVVCSSLLRPPASCAVRSSLLSLN